MPPNAVYVGNSLDCEIIFLAITINYKLKKVYGLVKQTGAPIEMSFKIFTSLCLLNNKCTSQHLKWIKNLLSKLS